MLIEQASPESVERASPEIQLAVDLIYLLECNEIAPETALAALTIVRRDCQEKLDRQHSHSIIEQIV
ncbi:pleiotropic regulatory protein RsmS [Candidatus Fukatsuia symbiotica]|uniref:DUF2496 domain-containing protein n=1 Tax=Candidatus Fukatsuia symbiotica TaxID=1878942 RepID=A0A2U8IAG8_9GAMM|nr:pleiotropic regulatory protein RsmS [Candidatus Fukatsuia symbiotica]AWK15184.1 DUF2496 domain-containing protein [Candidatus Fukatsuia symbiotica]MEA9444016.1 pleiotropic regulatory protein RsmS [Candidatus Fukatsuia symbiotica]